jgi:hypothetical protein
MGMTQMTWEDDDNNRRVALTAEYSVANDALTIEALTPTHVHFLCPTSGDVVRTIRVWTEAGRSLLAGAFRSSRQFEQLTLQLAEDCQLAAQV